MLTFPPDITFVIQIVSFLVLWYGLKRLLFEPVLHVLEERESRTAGARQLAAEIHAAAEGSAAEYERRVHAVRLALGAETEAARSVTQTEERRVVSAAREDASAQLTRLRENLSTEAQAARPALATDARDLAVRILERVVGRQLA